MTIYGILGSTVEIICPEHSAEPHYIKMLSSRPSLTHHARDDGTWGISYAEQAKAHRSLMIDSNIKVFDVYWQVDPTSIQFMRRTIEAYELLLQVEAHKPVEERNPVPNNTIWILADNTTRVTDYNELRMVVLAYTMRIGEIFRQYNIWRAGDNDTQFVFVSGD